MRYSAEALELLHSFAASAAQLCETKPDLEEAAPSCKYLATELSVLLGCDEEQELRAELEAAVWQLMAVLRALMCDKTAWSDLSKEALGPDSAYRGRMELALIHLMMRTSVEICGMAYAALGEFASDTPHFSDSQDALAELLEWTETAQPPASREWLRQRAEQVRDCLRAAADDDEIGISVGHFVVRHFGPDPEGEEFESSSGFDGFLEESPESDDSGPYSEFEGEACEDDSGISLDTIAASLMLDTRNILAAYRL